MVLADDLRSSIFVSGLSGLDSLLLLVLIASLPSCSWFMNYRLCYLGHYKVNVGTKRNSVISP